ncbi:uncharacterized protein [Macrobrachium rosenbergii]|uniref:uncharacterized protein n=1 Tax=Macrobrachium rosenbergii TaxID=79674 RepID=UPI0034D6CA60
MSDIATEMDALAARMDASDSQNAKEVGGYCLLKNQTQLCDGTQFSLRCLGTDCFCCVPDTRICIEKEGCLERNGYCLKQGGWTTCNREIDSYFCLGDKCACCRETECVRSSQCRNMGGYCYRQKADPSKQHICNGLMVSGGCGDSNCICCVPYSG